MLKKTIKFVDYDGVEREEDFYFNINEAEAAELEMSLPGGFKKALEHAVAKKDGPALMLFYKKIILMSYGVKSPDGRRFKKSQEIRDDFEQCPAYVELFMELGTNAEAAKNFVEKVFDVDASRFNSSNVVQLSNAL